MTLHVGQFVKKLSREALKEYLTASDLLPETGIDWDASDKDYCAQVAEFLKTIPDKESQTLWADFDSAELLAKDSFGRNAMRSVLGASELCEKFDALPEARACALWLACEDRTRLRNAISSHYMDRSCNGRSWGAFELDQSHEPLDDLFARDAFQSRVSEILSKDEANGRLIVEWFARTLPDPGTQNPRKVTQAAIYREEPPSSDLVFRSDKDVVSTIRRPVSEAALVYDQERAAIDIACKGGKPRQQAICDAFCQSMVKSNAPATAKPRPDISFAPLTRRPHFEIRPEDGIESVDVEIVRVRSDHAGGLCVTLQNKGQKYRTDKGLHDQAASAFGDKSPIGRKGWSIDHARLRVDFDPEAEHGGGKVAFDLYAPNRHNLREQTDRHRLVLNKLLTRWGFFAGAA